MPPFRAVIVDDSPEFIKIARRYLEHSPHIRLVGIAENGADAIDLIREHRPELVLLDLVLPDINGVGVTRAVKAPLPNTLVAIMTLYDLDEYRAEALAAGADVLINKSELSDAWIQTLVEKMILKNSRPNILVVDDSPTIRRMIMSALKPLDADFGEASTGLEAVEQLAVGDYNVVTLDLNMPDMHGIEVLQVLRGSERYHDLPVIVLTTRGDDDSREAALGHGADVYITKPFQPQELLKAVKELLPQ